MSYSFTKSHSFTITNARHLASKVAADMYLCAQYYGNPTEQRIRQYAEELAQYLNNGYLAEYEFGYKKDGIRIVSWRYNIDASGAISTDDSAGKVIAYVDVSRSSFYNFLMSNRAFSALSPDEQAQFKASLPLQRTVGDPPSDGDGYWTSDRKYLSGGQGLIRQTFRSLP